MEKTNKNIIININGLVDISPDSLDSKINNIQPLVVKKKTSDYKKIYKYNVKYIQDSDNKNVIDIDKDITIYTYYKEFYKNYKNYDIRSSLLQIKIIEKNLKNKEELVIENLEIIYNISTQKRGIRTKDNKPLH